jgi:hypothetical protein
MSRFLLLRAGSTPNSLESRSKDWDALEFYEYHRFVTISVPAVLNDLE